MEKTMMQAKQETAPALLDSYAEQGRMFLSHAAQNLLQFGRVLIEAKKLVPRGQFEAWVKESFGFSERTAQNYMATYRRFGGEEKWQSVQFSKLQEMLALPEGAEERFCEDNDLDNMTAREVKRAVQEVRSEAQAQIEKEREARRAAEQELKEMQEKPADIPVELADKLRAQERAITEARADARRAAESAREALEKRNEAMRKLAEAERDRAEAEEMLADNQQEYDRMQAELLDMRSAQAKGDAERTPADELTAEVFAGAVRQFIGTCARMPQMGKSFGWMKPQEWNAYDELLRTVESWAQAARRALDTVCAEIR